MPNPRDRQSFDLRRAGMIIAVLFAACAVPPRFELHPRSENLESKGPVLWVRSLTDARTNRVVGSRWKCLIPGVATSREHRPRPEVGAGLDFEPEKDLRPSLAQLARESGRFSQVVLELPEIDRAGTLMILDATIHELSLDLHQFSYYLGPVATLFWCLSFPTGELSTHLDISIRLTDSLSRPLYGGDLKGKRRRLRGLYFNADWRRPWLEAIEELLRREWSQLWSQVDTLTEKDS